MVHSCQLQSTVSLFSSLCSVAKREEKRETVKGGLKMAKPRGKAESRWRMELAELRYVCHTREFRKWVKRQCSKAIRREAKKGGVGES